MAGPQQIVDFQPFPGCQADALFAGRFRLEHPLGSGKLGPTWVARDELQNRAVALKFLPFLLSADREIMRRELANWIGWSNRCFVETSGLFEDGNVLAISGELISGSNLQLALSRQSGHLFDVPKIEGWVTELCSGLEAAYGRFGYAHGAISPTNLLLDGTGHLKILHFGLTTLLRLAATDVDRAIFLDPSAYTSLQVRNGALPELSDDVYAIAVILYELLTGELPSGSSSLQTGHEFPSIRVRRKILGIKAPVSDAWESTIINCLQTDISRRPQDIAALTAALKAGPKSPTQKSAVASPPPQPPIQGPAPRPAPPPLPIPAPARKKRYGHLLALLTSGAIVVYLVWPKNPAPPPPPEPIPLSPSPLPTPFRTPWSPPSTPEPTPWPPPSTPEPTPWSPPSTPEPTPWSPPSTPEPTPWPSSTAPPATLEGERYPQTRLRLLSNADVSDLGFAELRYAINEMYARYGATFPNHPEIENQFRRFSWYHPNPGISYDEIDSSMSDIEKENVKLLARYRDQKNSRPVPQAGESLPGERYPITRQRLLTDNDVKYLSYAQLRYAINEMYARHGAPFPNHPEIENQFRKFNWYQPIPGRSFDNIDDAMSDIEKENVKILAAYRALRAPK
jgi:serine/threonine protein kinase